MARTTALPRACSARVQDSLALAISTSQDGSGNGLGAMPSPTNEALVAQLGQRAMAPQ
ncbi:MAG: hypothetical protein ACRD0L_01040 [Acidimicrobiales bacterium]